MPFQFHYDGQTWDYEDLTGEELEALEAHLGVRYFELEPALRARDTLAILATFLSRKMSEEQVTKAIKKISLRTIKDHWSWTDEPSLPTEFEEGVPDPKAAVVSGTGTSSSSRGRRSPGLRT